MSEQFNIYRDPHHGEGWIAEVLSFGRWQRVGVFGTRAAALAALCKV